MDVVSDIASVNIQLWAFVPPLIAIITVFFLRNAIASLFIGILSGAAMYAVKLNTRLLGFLNLVFSSIFDTAVENIGLIGFILLIGALMSVITLSGGHYAYGRWVSRKVKNARGMSLATVVLGVLMFIDDYFSCLITGSVMGPVTEKYKVSREKLAYFVDVTSGTVCMLAPLSSWSPTIIQVVDSGGVGNGLITFVRSIPYNFYAVFTILFALYIAFTRKDFSAMRKYEMAAESLTPLEKFEKEAVQHNKGRIADLVLPNLVVILLVFLSIAWLGGFFGPEKISLIEVVSQADITMAINFGCLGTLAFCFFMYVPRKLLSVRLFFEGAIEGMKNMFTVSLILILVWSLGVITIDSLGAGTYIDSVMQGVRDTVNISFLPIAIFLISLVISPGLGSWGTFLMTIPLISIIANATDPSMFHIFVAATLAGSVFGDHASPITDTNVLSSVSAKCDPLNHVKSQLPYALLIALGSAASFVFMGFFKNLAISYLGGTAVIVGTLLILYHFEQRKIKIRAKN
jgi:Na+/H+ antiporter NhaC